MLRNIVRVCAPIGTVEFDDYRHKSSKSKLRQSVAGLHLYGIIGKEVGFIGEEVGFIEARRKKNTEDSAMENPLGQREQGGGMAAKLRTWQAIISNEAARMVQHSKSIIGNILVGVKTGTFLFIL